MSGVVTLAIGISACKTSSSDVEKLGPDIYRLSVTSPVARGGSVEAKRLALSQATEICVNSGKDAFVITLKAAKNQAEVEFRCEDRGQPNLQQP